ncbi:TPA: two pore domain potassium channel family protein [Candidatus Woesearchaeota archaeon]|nr:two pore domain potassium channel family protein [Candidatus Woesearchaeota archaeon]
MERYDRQLLIATSIVIFYMFAGTILFHLLEGWSFVDAFYFSGVTLTTVGYGDLTPHTDLAKIIAVLFAFTGISVVFYALGVIARRYFEREEERLQKIWETTHPQQLIQPVTSIAQGITHVRKHIGAITRKKREPTRTAILESARKHRDDAATIMRR